jgi:Major Facilitator Superfamily.
MPQAAFYSWGWRVPFIASILIAVTGLYMRRSMEETAAFSKVVEQGEVPKNPILEVFRTQRGSVLKIFFSLAGINVLTWVCIPFTTTLLVSILKYPPALGFSVAVMQTILVIIAAPLFGRLADKINRKKMVLCNLALLVILAYPLYSIITTTKSLGMLYLVVGILGMAVPSITAAFYPYYVELFPANVRASGLSIAYNLGQMVFGGTALYIVTYLTKLNGVMSVPIYLMGMLAVTFITILFFFPQQLRKEL